MYICLIFWAIIQYHIIGFVAQITPVWSLEAFVCYSCILLHAPILLIFEHFLILLFIWYISCPIPTLSTALSVSQNF